MTDNIKPKHYRTGEEDHYESWSKTYPFNEYRAIMQAIAERYIRRNKVDRVEDINKAIYTLERLKEKEIEYRDNQARSNDEQLDKSSETIHKLDNQEYPSLLISFLNRGFEYIARDSDNELWVFDVKPVKFDTHWSDYLGDYIEPLNNDYFPEVKWSDEEPTKIADLWDIYGNCGENGK